MDVGVLSVLWLLPAMVLGGVLRDVIDFEYEPCPSYTQDGLLYLDCSNQGLTQLPQDLNYKAQVVILANNNFVSFPKQLELFTELEQLDLSGNRLSIPLPTYTTPFLSLKVLNLSNNNFDTWPNNDLFTTFHTLDLSKNKINSIETDAFSKTVDLTFLDLSENRLNDLPITTFSRSSSLRELNLSRNYFVAVPQFECQFLEVLHMSNCQISQLSREAISGMTSLTVLDLSINQIESIPDNFVSGTLQELILSYNELNTLTINTFASLPRLVDLDLRGNEFKEVWSTSYFATNIYLRTIYVRGNRWSCEGFSDNLLFTYTFLTKEPAKVNDEASLTCYSPSNVTQMSWKDAYIETWRVNDNSYTQYTLMAVVIGIIIGVVVTSCVCRSLMFINKPEPSHPLSNTITNTTPAVEIRIPLRSTPVPEDLPPTYDEALLLPRLNSSFHSLPDFVDEEENCRRNRRSRSIGDLVETRPRLSNRRSIRGPLRLNSNVESRGSL